MDVAAN